EQIIRLLCAKKIDGRISPAYGSHGEARPSRSINITGFVTDRDGTVGTRALPLDDRMEFGSLAQQRRTACVVFDPSGIVLAQNTTDVCLGVRCHDCDRDIALGQPREQGVNAVEQPYQMRITGDQLSHISGDERHLPGRNSQIANDVDASFSPEVIHLGVGDLPEAVAPRNMVDRRSKPCGAVGERSIKVEDGEVITVHCIVYYCERQVVIRRYVWGDSPGWRTARNLTLASDL